MLCSNKAFFLTIFCTFTQTCSQQTWNHLKATFSRPNLRVSLPPEWCFYPRFLFFWPSSTLWAISVMHLQYYIIVIILLEREKSLLVLKSSFFFVSMGRLNLSAKPLLWDFSLIHMRRGMKESQQIRHESTCHHSSKCIYKCDDHVPRSCEKSNDTQRGVCLLTVCQLVVKASHVRINNNSKICLLQKNSQKKKRKERNLNKIN